MDGISVSQPHKYEDNSGKKPLDNEEEQRRRRIPFHPYVCHNIAKGLAGIPNPIMSPKNEKKKTTMIKQTSQLNPDSSSVYGINTTWSAFVLRKKRKMEKGKRKKKSTYSNSQLISYHGGRMVLRLMSRNMAVFRPVCCDAFHRKSLLARTRKVRKRSASANEAPTIRGINVYPTTTIPLPLIPVFP